MSSQRVVAAVSSSSSIVFRFSSTQCCRHALRQFSYAQSARMSSKRKMQTSTAYHPSSLEPHLPPPPRNTDVPDTSIAGPSPRLNYTRSAPQKAGEQEQASGETWNKQATFSVPEQEAQKSKPVTAPTPSTTTATTAPSPQPQPQPRPKSRPKLRARKAAMNLTPEAVRQLRQMSDQPSPKLIKVGVRNRGCSGLAYHLEYVDKPGAFDELVEQDGVKVLIDSKALFSIIGSEMDWVEDKLNQRFVFKNPNISEYLTFCDIFLARRLIILSEEQCGCGESFMV